MGLEDLLDDSAALIVEWPEGMGAHLPKEHLWIDFDIGAPQLRHLHFRASGSRHQHLLKQLQSQFDARTDN